MFGANTFGWPYFGQAFPSSEATEGVPFIASVTTVYAPSLPEVTAPFIASTTVLHAPTVQPTEFSAAGTYSWLCPEGVTYVTAEAYGGGGGGGNNGANTDGGGGGGGAYAKRVALAVTPGTTYTVIVGAGGQPNTTTGVGHDGGSSSFTGDAGVQVVAAGGSGGPVGSGNTGLGGQASASTGDTGAVFSGGNGGTTVGGAGQGGDGGGASGSGAGAGANGHTGTGGGPSTGGAGGVGAGGGGSGGDGGGYAFATSPTSAHTGFNPGGGGGGGGGFATGAAGADGSIVLTPAIVLGLIGSTTQIYSPSLPAQPVAAPFIATVTIVYPPALPEINAPFIGSSTHAWGVWSTFDPNKTYGGTGNGGQAFPLVIAPASSTVTATLAASITAADRYLALTGDSGLPATAGFMVTIDSEVLYVKQLSAGNYFAISRAQSNTTTSSHTVGAAVTWTDSYDMPILVTDYVATDFTADIMSTGSSLYTGWLMAFDSTQAYLPDGSRYPFHVTELVGVFAAGAGTSGSNKTDGAQPSAVHVPEAASDHCGAALTVPALITTNLEPGDVVVVRYTNPEATTLALGPRAVGIQSWFGMKRVDTSDVDVTYTNPNGIIVDTKSGYDTYTSAVNIEPDEPLAEAVGIAKDSSDLAGYAIPTPGTVPWLNATLAGTDRYFTNPDHYSENGWPIGMVSVRQGNRRVPFWQSWDWHDFSWLYTGFGTDASFAQVVINRNGMTGALPTITLPGTQDIDGPAAYWDDGTYYFGSAWYVALVATPLLVAGPGSGTVPAPGTNPGIPVVSFLPDFTPSITPPPTIEGGSGGGISPSVAGLHIWQRSGGFF